MALVRTLIDCEQQHAEPSLSQGLRELYDGDLHFPPTPAQRPYIIANFVSTLDGVVSYKIRAHAAGATISGFDQGDRFIMGLLRASVDAIILGSRTVEEVSPEDLWIPAFTYPGAKDLYTDYRRTRLHKPQHPLVIVVSGSGRIDLNRAIFRTPETPTLILTTAAGRKQLATRGAPSVEIRVLDDVHGNLDPIEMVQLLASQFGVQRLLHEGGPTLFGEYLTAGIVDELFLTLAPQIAGRTPLAPARPAIVQGVEFLPNTAPWFQLLSVKQHAEHLYLRYQRTDAQYNPVSQLSDDAAG